MYRTLAIFPKTADPALVEDLVQRSAAAFKASAGFLRATTSVDALMGPSARAGEHGVILEADFESLEDALAALNSDSLGADKERTESLQPVLLLFECRDI